MPIPVAARLARPDVCRLPAAIEVPRSAPTLVRLPVSRGWKADLDLLDQRYPRPVRSGPRKQFAGVFDGALLGLVEGQASLGSCAERTAARQT